MDSKDQEIEKLRDVIEDLIELAEFGDSFNVKHRDQYPSDFPANFRRVVEHAISVVPAESGYWATQARDLSPRS